MKIATEETVSIPTADARLTGDLTVPKGARGIVLFAHGSGSSRLSPRNRFVARELVRAGLAALLIDLLTPEEERLDDATAELRFDIPFLARRLAAVSNWLKSRPETRGLALGYFGASTGAAAALTAAAADPGVFAVVSRGGRPDLALESLPRVTAPTLLIVGGEDGPVIGMNEVAAARLRAERRLVIVPGATHLFEEPGALETVARLAAEWFVARLPAAPTAHAGAGRKFAAGALLLALASAAFAAAPAKDHSEWLFPYDLGPASVDVSSYPARERSSYTVFAGNCSQCHTLARSINAPFVSREDWEPYLSRMHVLAKPQPWTEISAADYGVIMDFLVFDSHERKVKRAASFRKQAKELERLFAEVAKARGLKKGTAPPR